MDPEKDCQQLNHSGEQSLSVEDERVQKENNNEKEDDIDAEQIEQENVKQDLIEEEQIQHPHQQGNQNKEGNQQMEHEPSIQPSIPKPARIKRQKRKMRNTALYDKSEREQITELFTDLIDIINLCYTGVNLNKDKQEYKKKGGDQSEQYSGVNDSQIQGSNLNNEVAKAYTSTRIKRKPVRKYSQQEKEAARAKQQKQKRLQLRKNASTRGKNVNTVSAKQQEKIKEKQKQICSLSVQEIINRKLQEQRNQEKSIIFKDYSVLMNYMFENQLEEDSQINLNFSYIPNQPNGLNLHQSVAMVEKGQQPSQQKQKKGISQVIAIKKFSIEKCLEVSVQPQNFTPS